MANWEGRENFTSHVVPSGVASIEGATSYRLSPCLVLAAWFVTSNLILERKGCYGRRRRMARHEKGSQSTVSVVRFLK